MSASTTAEVLTVLTVSILQVKGCPTLPTVTYMSTGRWKRLGLIRRITVIKRTGRSLSGRDE
jgi:hypothetical protein